MKPKSFSTTVKVLAAAVAMFAAGSASAVTLASGSNAGPLASPDSFSITVNNNTSMTSGNISFSLLGYNTLDGLNAYTDWFTLSVNSAPVFVGSFDMGGGGGSFAVGPSGTSWTALSWGLNQGGLTAVTLPITLLANSNNLITFAYASPGPLNFGSQGLGDEGWGVGKYVVTAVPEPETYAMMLAGLGIIGMMARRRRQADPSTA